MINTLPQSLIEAAKIILEDGIGIRKGKPKKLWGIDCDIHIRGNGYQFNESVLLEAITDWFKTTGRKNLHDFSDLSDEHFSNLSQEEKDAVKAYTYNSDPIKEHIRTKKEGHIVNIDYGVSANLHHLDGALEKNKLHEDLITYSGLRSSPFENNDSLGHVHSTTYISSSVDPVVAHNFSMSYGNKIHHIARIHNKKGSTGLYIGHNRDLTHSPLEFEYLIPKETNFRVNHEPEEIKDNNGNITHHVWDFYRG